MPSRKGFTLVEIMVALAIIGLLAVTAIGEFRGYQAKAKQSEAKINLEAIGTQATAYKSEFNTYSTTFSSLGWSPNQITRYRYWYNGYAAPGTPSPVNLDPAVDYTDPGSHADRDGFTSYAVGNIDNDPMRDVWSNNQNRRLYNDQNDTVLN